MKKTISTASAALAAAAGLTLLGGPGPACADDGLAFNVGAVSDYRYRGISQSRLKTALQGGVDWTPGPLYLGAWASTIHWVKDAGGGADVEVDLYGGVKGELTKGLTYDVGGLYYAYPDNRLGRVAGLVNADTFEVYAALGFGPATLKYSHALSNTFGNPDSRNSGYLDLSASVDLGQGWSLAPHLGHQRISGPSSAYSYSDAALALNKDLGDWAKGLTASATLYATDADRALYLTPAGRFTGRSGVVLGLKLSF